MNKLYKFLLAIALFTLFSQSVNAVVPTYDMTIKNISLTPGPFFENDSILTFDIYIWWTNASDPACDPFEFGASQIDITFNPALYGSMPVPGPSDTGGIKASKIAISGGINFPSIIQNPTVKIIGNLFQASANNAIPATDFFVSSVYPGNRMLRVKIRTRENQFPYVFADLKFRLSPPNNTFCAYFEPPPDPKNPDFQLMAALLDTVANHYQTENNIFLPVELQSFSSTVSRNNVSLHWSTAREENNNGFDIERKISGSNDWTKAGFIQGNGNSNETKNYAFTERVSSGKYNYRLKQIDFNGNTEYFNLVNEVEVGIPSAYALSQNYPNPFNPTTKIDYELPYDGKISILLYDISGREVGNLVNEIKPAGYYTVEFNASNLSSGMYFYRINAGSSGRGNFISTKKMMLIK